MKSIKRFIHICKALFPPLFQYLLSQKKPNSEAYKKSMLGLRIALQQLGPTFVKFGQLLSARPDLIGYNLSNEFRNLLDNEPIIPYETIIHIIDAETKKDSKKIFRKIEHTPLATASIGQVHKAVLHNGKTVAVKVQRPGIQTIINNDLPILKRISKLLDTIISLKGLKFFYIYQQFEDWILHELDFQVEARRASKFQENMQVMDGVHIPAIYWDYATERMLVMEYVEGYTLNEILNLMEQQKVKTLYDLKIDMKINPDELIHNMIAAVAKQALVDGFFHGDLHPANIIIQKHNEITLIDFGIVGTLNQEEKMQILLCMLALVEADPNSLVKVFTSLIADPLSPQQLAELHQELADELHKLHEDAGGKITLNHVLSTIIPMSAKYHMMWSAGFMLAFKSIGQIDSVAQRIGLRTSLVDLMKPEVEKAVTMSFASDFTKETAYKEIMDLLQAGKRLPETLAAFEDVINNSRHATASFPAESNTTRNSLLLCSALIVATPFVFHAHIPTSIRPLLFIGMPLLFIVILVKIFTIGRK